MGCNAGEQDVGRVRVGFLVHRGGRKVGEVVRIGGQSCITASHGSYAFWMEGRRERRKRLLAEPIWNPKKWEQDRCLLHHHHHRFSRFEVIWWDFLALHWLASDQYRCHYPLHHHPSSPRFHLTAGRFDWFSAQA